MAQARVLVVEDEKIIAALLNRMLSGQGYEVKTVGDGETAWAILQNEGPSFTAILLDRGLPRLDGLELLRRIKASTALCRIPVILETGLSDVTAIREGLSAGAYYYLVKPFQRSLLLAVVAAAISQYRDLMEMEEAARRAECSLRHLRRGTLAFRTLDEATELSHLLAGGFPDPERVITGFQELLVNAVEHGNLGITYAEKGALVLREAWRDEVDRRLALPENRDKEVTVEFNRGADEISVVIRDQGPGFDWRPFLDMDPARAFDPHGRGIALARMTSFDTLDYLGTGNTVRVAVRIDGLLP